MKYLNVKWVPETVAIVSLTIAVGRGVESEATAAEKSGTALRNDAPIRRIVIFQGADLRTDVLVAR